VTAEIGIFGGSGFYSLAEGLRTEEVQTPYGAPSGPVSLGEVAGRPVAFIPRHGPKHEIPAHRVNYRANLWAMRELGVTRVLGPCAAGSLQRHVEPGHVVVCDQLVDRTYSREQTFYDGPDPVHISFAEPYCPELRPLACEAVREAGLPVHERGTVVVIQGPRFSTKAESAWFGSAGWEVINMTQYPEAYLARELEMCYVNVSLITDHDAYLRDGDGVEPITMDEVFRMFAANLDTLRQALLRLVERVPTDRSCPCSHAWDGTPLRP
jgi:5'-methylthioadenosine phosphorylase